MKSQRFYFFIFLLFFSFKTMFAHCQIPCGIYDDKARIASMLEDAHTIEKALIELSKNDLSKNQLIRWVNNKELHAQNIINCISNYFLAQKLRSSEEKYEEILSVLHNVIINAVKVKQITRLEYCNDLKESIQKLKTYY